MRTLVLFTLLLAACAHTPDLPLRPDPSPPAGSTVETFEARDGTTLFERQWKPAGEPKAAVVIVHGLLDYSARYGDLATRLTAAGYAVYAFDLRGHGHSAGPRVAPDDWQDYVDDLDRFLTHVEQREAGKRVFVFAHSMGGAIALLAAERHAPKIAGLVLSGPAIQVDAPPLLVAITRMSGALTPMAPALSLDHHDFSRDPALPGAMDHDEWIEQGAAPARTAAGLIEGMHQIWEGADALTMPVLALHGSADRLTSPAGSRALIARIPSTDKTLHVVPDAFHDLLHEPEATRTQVATEIVAWIDAHAGGPAVAAPAAYEGHLPGETRGWTQAVEATAGASRADGSEQFTGSFAVNLARPAPIGWSGQLTARMASGVYRAVSLRPIGIAARAGAAEIGVTAGAAFVTGSSFAMSGGGWLELPAGPLHLGASAEWTRLFSNSSGAGPIGSDLLWLSGSARLGGDRAYWPGARAGVGPVLSIGGEWVGAQSGAFATIGLQLCGAD